MTHTDSAEMVSAVKKFAAFPAAVSAAGDASLGKFRSGLRAASLFGDKAFENLEEFTEAFFWAIFK